MKIKKNKQGFTLIELLVVLFIIGLLTGIILPNLMGYRLRARDGSRKRDLESIKTALRMYYNDYQSYPDEGGLYGLDAKYMPEVPVDPLGENYEYCTDANKERFMLMACLENSGDPDIENSVDRCSAGICDLDPDLCGVGRYAYYVCVN